MAKKSISNDELEHFTNLLVEARNALQNRDAKVWSQISSFLTISQNSNYLYSTLAEYFIGVYSACIINNRNIHSIHRFMMKPERDKAIFFLELTVPSLCIWVLIGPYWLNPEEGLNPQSLTNRALQHSIIYLFIQCNWAISMARQETYTQSILRQFCHL